MRYATMNVSLFAVLCLTLGIEAADKAIKVTYDCSCEGTETGGNTTVEYISGMSENILDDSCSYPDISLWNKLHQGIQNDGGKCKKGRNRTRILEECYCNHGKKFALTTYFSNGKVVMKTGLEYNCRGKRSDLIECGSDIDTKPLECPTGWQKNHWAVDGKWGKDLGANITSPSKCIDVCLKKRATDNSITHANYMDDPGSQNPHACYCMSGSRKLILVPKGYDVCELQKPECPTRWRRAKWVWDGKWSINHAPKGSAFYSSKKCLDECLKMKALDNSITFANYMDNPASGNRHVCYCMSGSRELVPLSKGYDVCELQKPECPTRWQKGKWAVDGKWGIISATKGNAINSSKKCIDECMKRKETDNSITHANYMDNPASTPPHACYCMSGSKILRPHPKGYDVCELKKTKPVTECPTGLKKKKWAVDGDWGRNLATKGSNITSSKKCIVVCLMKKAIDNSITHANYMDNPRSDNPHACFCMIGSKILSPVPKGYDVCDLQIPEKDAMVVEEAVQLEDEKKKLNLEEDSETSQIEVKEELDELVDEVMKMFGLEI